MSAAWPAADHVHNLGSTSTQLYTPAVRRKQKGQTQGPRKEDSQSQEALLQQKRLPFPSDYFIHPKIKLFQKNSLCLTQQQRYELSVIHGCEFLI